MNKACQYFYQRVLFIGSVLEKGQWKGDIYSHSRVAGNNSKKINYINQSRRDCHCNFEESSLTGKYHLLHYFVSK